MLALSVRVVLPEESVVVPITPRVAVNFERHFKVGLSKAFSTEERLEHMYWLGWEALRVSGRVVKPFEVFLDEVQQVRWANGEDDAVPLAD